LPDEPDLTNGFRALRLEHLRFPQDCMPNTLTLGGIFPNEGADPDAPSSYVFADIDRHVSAARRAGAEILWQASYDVGRSDRWVGLNLGGRPPEDLERWSRVVERCLEHFNNGWGSGFDYAVRNAEFLNEPDGLGGFSGPHAARLFPAFARFLRLIARYNEKHPTTPVRAVGPGIPLSLAEWKQWQPRFAAALDRLRAEKLELPVFSFHTYGADVSPRANAELARAIRGLLDAKGMRGTELWNTEWQAGDFLKEHLRVDAARAASATDADRNKFASALAAYAIACKLRWQGVVRGSYYYRANRRAFPPGLAPKQHALGVGRFLSPNGTPQRLGLHEELMRRAALAAPQRCTTHYEDDGLLTVLGLRADDGRTLAVMVSSLLTTPRRLLLRWSGADPNQPWRARVLTLDARDEDLRTSALAVPGLTSVGAELSVRVGPLSSALFLLESTG